MYSDSLTDSWLSIWAASPQYVEQISFIESERAVPIDALAWTQVYADYRTSSSGKPGWREEFERIFDVEGVPRWRLEYLVPDDPEQTVGFNAAFAAHPKEANAAEVFAKAFGGGEELTEMLSDIFELISEYEAEQAQIQGMRLPLGMETAYRLNVQGSGIPSLLWGLGVRAPLSSALCGITLRELSTSPGDTYDKAQQLRLRWDEDAKRFTAKEFDEMHRLFVEALGNAAQAVCLREASDVGRNEQCPCGSGRKFKKCHGAHHDVDWYVGLKDA